VVKYGDFQTTIVMLDDNGNELFNYPSLSQDVFWIAMTVTDGVLDNWIEHPKMKTTISIYRAAHGEDPRARIIAALIHLQHLGEEVPVPGDVARMDVHLDRLTFGQKKKEEGDVVSIW